MYITRPVEESKLKSFYERVHPGGPGWRKISAVMPDVKSDTGYWFLFSDWVCGIILVYMFLFGIGKIILGSYFVGVIYLILGLAAGWLILKHIDKLGWETAAGVSK
jgi:hypothetical protein